MNPVINYFENVNIYPDIITDIVREIGILRREFEKLVIGYGDGFDYTLYDDEECTIDFRKSYLIEKRPERCMYIPYDKIYEIIIYYKTGE